jgi:hypothetical protein
MGGCGDGCNGIRHSAVEGFPWNKKLAKYVKVGQLERHCCFSNNCNMSLHKFTVFQVLNSCASLQALAEARHAHEKIIEIGCATNFFCVE